LGLHEENVDTVGTVPDVTPQDFRMQTSLFHEHPRVVEQVLGKDGMLLQFCAESMKTNPAIVRCAMRQNLFACRFARGPVKKVAEGWAVNMMTEDALKVAMGHGRVMIEDWVLHT